jgi:hypothetical protein
MHNYWSDYGVAWMPKAVFAQEVPFGANYA